MNNKKELRKYFLEKRKTLSEFDIDLNSRIIAEELVETINFDQLKCMHVFLPSTRHEEIDTWKLINLVRHRYEHVEIVVPQANYETNEMSTCLLEPDTHLILDKFGIPEPEDLVPVDESAIDLVVLPLVIADKNGGRVGYGKGFYDRFLARLDLSKVKLVGVCLFEPVDHIEDLDPHDIKIQTLITPSRVYNLA